MKLMKSTGRRTLISLDQALSSESGSEQSLIDTLVDGRYQTNQMAKEGASNAC